MVLTFDSTSPDIVYRTYKAIGYSPDNDSILVGCGDAHLKVFDPTGRHMYTWNTAGKKQIKLPVTSLKFRPFTQNRKNIVLVAGSGGVVQHWHITSGRCLHTITEKENQVYAVDYRQDGKVFATAGKDTVVRVYDEATKSLMNAMKGGTTNMTAGHSNRVFTLKFFPGGNSGNGGQSKETFEKGSSPLLLSAGWDNTVQIFDIRQENAIRRIFGPHICGDALDIDHNGVILTGSWRSKNQLQTWDFGTGKMLEEFKIPSDPNTKQKCNVYTACFSNGDAKYIAYGGSGSNEAKVIERSSGKFIGSLSGLPKAVYSVNFSPDNATVAAAGGDGKVYLMGSKI